MIDRLAVTADGCYRRCIHADIFQQLIYGCGKGPPDPSEFMTLLQSTQDVPGSGNNLSSYVNPEVDALIAQGKSVPGCAQAERAEIYREIQRITHEDVAYNFNFVPSIWQIANQRVEGFEPGPSWVFYGYTDYLNEWSLSR